MVKKMMDLMEKKMKQGKKLDPTEKEAKEHVLKTLMDDMSGMMSDKLKGLKKVTVAADSKEDLEKGLEKAKEIIEGEDEESSELSPEMAAMAPDEDLESEDSEEESEDELERKIQELMEKKEALKNKKL